MRKEQEFLHAILASPGDVPLRLAYADWLEEQDDTRHELIRVCEDMRKLPVWSDRYWERKARRNALWTQHALEWVEALGYDGSSYTPIFRDGVPVGVKERWRLLREFTERWHGIDVPDVGGWQDTVARAEDRLRVKLPSSVAGYIAFVHDLRDAGTPNYDPVHSPSLFHCAYYRLDDLDSHQAVGLCYFTQDDSMLGVRREDLQAEDPPAWYFTLRFTNFQFHGASGAPVPDLEPPSFCHPTLSLSIFNALFLELPTAGTLETRLGARDAFLNRLARDFPIHARFDDTDLFEGNEILILVAGPRVWHATALERRVQVIVRRPVPCESVPDYLFGTDQSSTVCSGMLVPPEFRQQQVVEAQHQVARWVSPLRRQQRHQSLW